MAVKNNVNRTDGNSKNIKKIIITAAVCIVPGRVSIRASGAFCKGKN